MAYHRIDSNRIVADHLPFPATIFANERVKTDKAAFAELDNLALLAESLERAGAAVPELFSGASVEKAAITPDFHKGTGVPIGTTLLTKGAYFPKAMGGDIGCGMALFVLDGVDWRMAEKRKEALTKKLRHIFWGGGRAIPLTAEQRRAMFETGVAGVLASPGEDGIWTYANKLCTGITDVATFVPQVKCSAVFETYCGPAHATYDSQIGSVGGGNHFVELQRVKSVADSRLAAQAGIHSDSLLVMAHSGSLSIGTTASCHIDLLSRKTWPKGLKASALGFFPVAEHGDVSQEVMRLIGNAANFAAVNRLMLGLMVAVAIHETVGPVERFSMVCDAGHNFIEELPHGFFAHRKGACRAENGEWVVIPGSMGASSFLLSGLGNEESLRSSCHGAGRALSRGKSMKSFDNAFEEFMRAFTVVSAVDFATLRGDVKRRKLEDLKQEAPFAYKSITPVIETVVDSRIAKQVVELFPLLTIKS